ncbi:FtsH protease activity modulator HflK [Sphingomonas piscis]|uniref:Protein HflK n=1 Tax=Sphingomonas piscis TaxID=2714943 RepID=A0A6G7YQY8_9SPHN|nr:FtsH protease activity modulator HflK [Sphingomonas piscis]QIK79147.1 FtsH protease activity modulator HflK [Sphingomonas piscis]
MSIFVGVGRRALRLFADNKGPWGSSDGSSGDEPQSAPDKGPWGEQPVSGARRPASSRPSAASFDDLLKRGRARFGGGGGKLPVAPDRSFIVWGILAVLLVALLSSMMHVIAAEQRGVVTRFGRYSHTLSPGFSLTLPWPVDNVQKVDVDKIQEIAIGSGQEETLMLTADQNIIDIAYQVRWKIRDPEQYLFSLAEPDETIRQVAESVMRSVIANVSLNGAMGEQRGIIEARVADEMQKTLDAYQSGVIVQGIALRQADPPAAVNEAFKAVTAAQQAAKTDVNNATAYALQQRQFAQGQATAFDKVYEQYRLSPEVTRRRMYYETMERVLRNVDKTIVETPGVTPYLPLGEVRRSPAPRPAQ